MKEFKQLYQTSQQQKFQSQPGQFSVDSSHTQNQSSSYQLFNNSQQMFPTSNLRLTQSVSRIVEHVNTITSLQECQSRVESRISGEQEHAAEEYDQKAVEYDSIGRWMQVYRGCNAEKMFMLVNPDTSNNPLGKYQISPSENIYYQLKLKRLMNLQINLRDFSSSLTRSKSSQKIKSRSTQDLYLQFSLQFVNLDTELPLGTIYLSEYYRLEPSQTVRERYDMEEEINMYFYYSKAFESVGVRVSFFSVLCEKEGKVSMVVDKCSVGTVLIDLNDVSGEIYFLEHSIESYFDYSHKKNSEENTHNTKTDEYAQISIISSPSDGLTNLSSILIPFRIYTSESRVIYAKNSTFPKDLQNFRYQHSPYVLNFELTSITIPQSAIASAKTKCQNLAKLKHRDVQKIDEIEVKQYRMVVCCHNGEKLMSATSCLLKKAQIEELKNNNSNYKGSRHRVSTGENYQAKGVRESGKDNLLKLVSDGVTDLELVFDVAGVMIVFQVFCRVQIKLQVKSSSKQLSQSMILPLSYIVKPIISLQNDIKYIESLFNGELLGPKGIQSYIQQQKRKYEQNEKSRMRPNNLVSYEKILSKANSMTQSTIEFYVFKEKKEGPNRYHTTIEDSKDMSLSLSVVQKGHGNDINRLIMQKARIQRQRQKMQQKIHKINVQSNNNIPLLDPTELKVQIYQEKIKKMRDSKYELKTTLNYLKIKVDEFQRQQFVKKEMIQDTLGKVFGQNAQKPGELNLGQRLIGARGGMATTNKGFGDGTNQQNEEIIKAIIPQNNQQIQFPFTITNILKLIKNLKHPLVAEISISEIIFYHDNRQPKSFEIFYGFEQLKSAAYKNGSSDIIKITIALPQISPNLLTTILFSPFCLYFVNIETQSLIGHCFLYFSQLCNRIVLTDDYSTQGSLKLDTCGGFIYNRSQIQGRVNIVTQIRRKDQDKMSLYDKKELKLAGKDLNEQIESKLLKKNSVSEEEKRKLMRIQNFKKKATPNSQGDNSTSIKLKSQALQSANKQAQLEKAFSQLTGDKFNIPYHSLSYNIIKIPLHNKDQVTKSYQISIKDPDSQYFQSQFGQQSAQFQQLGCVQNSQFLKSGQEIINFNSQTQRFQLASHKSAILMLEYSSRRTYFCPRLKQIEMKHLTLSSSAKQQLLRTYNHKRNINITISSQTGVEKVINVNIEPKRDSNTINFTYYFEQQSEFAIPLPLCHLISRDNIYFSHESVELVSLQEQMFLCGFAPELNKVTLFEVFIYPKPELFGKLAQELQTKALDQNNFEDIQLIKKLIYSQKVINLSFEVWGCHRAKSYQLRLFEETDVLWEISRSHFQFRNQPQTRENNSYIHTISSSQPHIYLASSNPKLLGFRSSKVPSRINPCKNIALNQNQEKTLVKSVITPCLLRNQTVLVEAQNQEKREEVLCRYLINVRVTKPYFEEEFIFEMDIDQLEEVLEEKHNQKAKSKQSTIKTLKQSFLVDISSLMDNSRQEITPEKIKLFISTELKLHSSQSFLKVCSIEEETDPNKIKEFTSRKVKEQMVRMPQAKDAPLPQKKRNPTKDPKSSSKAKKQVLTSQSVIVQLHLQLDCELFAQKLKLHTTESESVNTKHMNLFEKALLNCVDVESAFLTCVVGLSLNEKILYYKVDVSRKRESDQRQLSLMREILEKSQVKMKTSSDNRTEHKNSPKAIDFKNLFRF